MSSNDVWDDNLPSSCGGQLPGLYITNPDSSFEFPNASVDKPQLLYQSSKRSELTLWNHIKENSLYYLTMYVFFNFWPQSSYVKTSLGPCDLIVGRWLPALNFPLTWQLSNHTSKIIELSGPTQAPIWKFAAQIDITSKFISSQVAGGRWKLVPITGFPKR